MEYCCWLEPARLSATRENSFPYDLKVQVLSTICVSIAYTENKIRERKRSLGCMFD